MKLAATRALGAEVILYDRVTESRDAVAAKLLDERGGTLVHAYGDPWIIEGQGSAGIEARAQLATRGIAGPDQAVACCGGGGLSAGLALACPNAEIIAVAVSYTHLDVYKRQMHMSGLFPCYSMRPC